MNRHLLLWLILLHGIHVLAQEKDTTVYNFDQIVPVGNNDMVVLAVDNKEKPSRLYLKYVDTNSQVLSEKYLKLGRRGIRGQLESVFYWNGKLNILSSLYYPGPKRNHLIFAQYELPTLNELTSKIIDEAYTPGLYRIPFGYSLSPDSTKILFYSWSYAIPDDPARLSLHVLDKDLQLIWQEYELLPFKNETLYIYGCQVDNQGKAYLLCENYEGKVRKYMTVREDKIMYFALLIEPGGKELRIYPLKIEEKIITGLKYAMGDDNDLYAAGFYKDKRTFEGLFLFRVDNESKKLSRKLFPISEETHKNAYNPDHDPNPQKGFYDYMLDELKISNDGSLYVLAEQRSEPQSSVPVTEYNDLLAIKISPKRTLEWLIRVPKRQKRVFAMESIFSYAAFEKNGQLFMLFNDEKDNASRRQKTQKLNSYPGEETINLLVRVNEDGSWRGSNITALIGSNVQLTIYPSYCWSLKDKLLIYGEQIENNQTKGYFVTLDWKLLGQ